MNRGRGMEIKRGQIGWRVRYSGNEERRIGGEPGLKNKRGQLGWIITSLPVMILVVVIMGIFIILAGLMSAFGGPAEEKAFLQTPDANLLLEEVIVDGEQITVFSKVFETSKESAREGLREVLFNLMNAGESDSCLFLLEEGKRIIALERREFEGRNAAVDSILDVEAIGEKYDLSSVSFSDRQGEHRTIDYYYGRCLDE